MRIASCRKSLGLAHHWRCVGTAAQPGTQGGTRRTAESLSSESRLLRCTGSGFLQPISLLRSSIFEVAPEKDWATSKRTRQENPQSGHRPAKQVIRDSEGLISNRPGSLVPTLRFPNSPSHWLLPSWNEYFPTGRPSP